MSRVLLFGAGASKGCGNVRPYAPPLGAELYAELRQYFAPSWGAMPSDVASLFSTDFEAGMEALWQRYSPAVPKLMQHMALYFNAFTPGSAGTLYGRLLDAVVSRGLSGSTLISTLNYENLIEFEAAARGLQIDPFEFPSAGALSIFKLHGSCNFVPAQIQATGGVSFTSGVTFDAGIRVLRGQLEVQEWMLGDNSLPPSMCLFMKDKPVQASPSAIRAIQARWRDAIGQATQVVVVGVRPNSMDAHLWDAMSTTPAEVIFVGDAAEIAAWTTAARGSRSTKVIAGRFDEAMPQLLNLMT